MNYEFLLYSFLFALGSYGFYLVHKSWLKTVTTKKSFHKTSVLATSIRHWVIIIGLGIGSLVYFILSF